MDLIFQKQFVLVGQEIIFVDTNVMHLPFRSWKIYFISLFNRVTGLYLHLAETDKNIYIESFWMAESLTS